MTAAILTIDHLYILYVSIISNNSKVILQMSY